MNEETVSMPGGNPDYFDPPRRNVKIGTFWNKPPTITYPSNFGFAVNGYQPMIDYLDAKDTGGTCSKKDIYLPYLEERCMDKYSAEKPFRRYTNVDIDNYIEKGDGIIRQIRQNDAVGIGSALNRTHTNWSMTKKWVQLVKKSQVVDYRKIREARLAEEQRDAPFSRRANNSRGSSRQTRSRTPSLTRRGAYSQGRSSGTPVRTRSSSAVPKRGINNKMVQTYDDVLSTLAHSKLDHELLMESRRQRLDELDSQFEDVIENLASNLARLNRKSTATDYDDTLEETDDQILENKMRRRQELERISDGVDELTQPGRSRRGASYLEYELGDMSDRVANISNRQREERLADLDALTALSHAAASYAARKKLARNIDLESVEDADVEYIRKRNAAVKQKVTIEKPKPKRNITPNAGKLSDVHARVINKASEMSNMSSAARRINHRARFINIYSPKPETGDKELIVKPTRTEINIDNMAKSFVERGKMTRRYAIDEEVDPPVSNINTNDFNNYRNREVQRTIAQVPSNSSRVRYAVIRARARNSILGY